MTLSLQYARNSGFSIFRAQLGIGEVRLLNRVMTTFEKHTNGQNVRSLEGVEQFHEVSLGFVGGADGREVCDKFVVLAHAVHQVADNA